jgi:uncharacterized sulfatase
VTNKVFFGTSGYLVIQVFRRLGCFLLVVSWLLGGACSLSGQEAPNVLLIIADDQGWGDYGFMGHPQLKTPNLDRLAAESLTFRRAYVPSSLCSPSLASLITGRYPHEHGITCNDPPRPADIKPANFQTSAAYQEGREKLADLMKQRETLPRWLSPAGYRSFQTGKWWPKDYRTGGFDAGMTQGGRHGDEGLDIGRKTLEPVFDFIQESQTKKQPFFVWYAPMLPHSPHNAPPELLEESRKTWRPGDEEAIGPYFANILWHDRVVGQLLDGLKRLGCDENTMVIYVTDNGWIPGAKKNSYGPKSKQSPYDGGLRTPLMVRWPGKVAPRMDDTPVSSLDIAPTILAAANVPLPADLPGLNLLDSKAVADRPAVFGECHTHDGVDLDRPASGLRWRWSVTGGRWKLIVPNPNLQPNSKPELYDLLEDPEETRNLAEQQSARVAELTQQLDAWWPGKD